MYVYVSKADIKAAIAESHPRSQNCPVARAIRRRVSPGHMVAGTSTGFRVYDANGRQVGQAKLPPAAGAFVRKFDQTMGGMSGLELLMPVRFRVKFV